MSHGTVPGAPGPPGSAGSSQGLCLSQVRVQKAGERHLPTQDPSLGLVLERQWVGGQRPAAGPSGQCSLNLKERVKEQRVTDGWSEDRCPQALHKPPPHYGVSRPALGTKWGAETGRGRGLPRRTKGPPPLSRLPSALEGGGQDRSAAAIYEEERGAVLLPLEPPGAGGR